MRSRSAICTVVLLTALAGCRHNRELSVTILPVPPKDSRWEGYEGKDKDKDRIELPLVDRQQLESALRYGLNEDNKERGSATNHTHYGQLLDLLSKPVTLADLSKPEFKKWFPGELVTQVVDARDKEFPKGPGPVAAADSQNGGQYWWIFYQDPHGNLTHVMVVNLQALTTLVERKR